jgi:hypothetical protein
MVLHRIIREYILIIGPVSFIVRGGVVASKGTIVGPFRRKKCKIEAIWGVGVMERGIGLSTEGKFGVITRVEDSYWEYSRSGRCEWISILRRLVVGIRIRSILLSS